MDEKNVEEGKGESFEIRCCVKTLFNDKEKETKLHARHCLIALISNERVNLHSVEIKVINGNGSSVRAEVRKEAK